VNAVTGQHTDQASIIMVIVITIIIIIFICWLQDFHHEPDTIILQLPPPIPSSPAPAKSMAASCAHLYDGNDDT